MTKEEIIASGLLELYVTDSLSHQDIQLVEEAIAKYPDLISEIEEIERSLMVLSEEVGGKVSDEIWDKIQGQTNNIRHIDKAPPKRSMGALTGWAAAILCFLGLFWMIKNNSDLKEQLRYRNTQNKVLQEKVDIQGIQLTETTELLEMVRSQDYEAINLPGNEAVSPSSYATVYYNAKENLAYIDAKGLPVPPNGKVYQVWSLKMEPLTPSSVGLLTNFEDTESRFFKVENIPTPEAFGITLEPEGGSESPSLDQLYALGTIAP